MPWNTDEYKGKQTFRVFFTRTKKCSVDIEADNSDEAEDIFYEGEYDKENEVKIGSTLKEVSHVLTLTEYDECVDSEDEYDEENED